ncbi:MAG TPA: ORF6N domain-containing protein [Elusimicrobiota bacterium]|nr:ORF6N domain-containing protein [Elusimicrobiota bacterium]
MKDLVLGSPIERRIYLIRGHKVMLDSDLADIYGVTTPRLNEQVRRNAKRFPPDFMFQLTKDEAKSLRSQFAISKMGRGGRRYLPRAFTEHGTVMLSAVLHTPVAIDTSIQIARAFVKLRDMISTHKELAAKLAELERAVAGHDKHIQSLFGAIHRLTAPVLKPKPPIGFQPGPRR